MLIPRTQVERFLLESKLFEISKRNEEEQSIIDQHANLDCELRTGAENPLEVSEKMAQLLKAIRSKAWDLGLAELSVKYDITAVGV